MSQDSRRLSESTITGLLDLCPRAFVSGLIAQRNRLERELEETRRELAILKGRQRPIILANLPTERPEENHG